MMMQLMLAAVVQGVFHNESYEKNDTYSVSQYIYIKLVNISYNKSP